MRVDSGARNLFAAVGFVTLAASGCAVSDQLDLTDSGVSGTASGLGGTGPGSGGNTGSGGVAATSTGGFTGTGGIVGSGGSTGTGGDGTGGSGTGGVTGSGGRTGSGGSTGTGGSAGSTGKGGAPGTGGSAGSTGKGGAPGTGGSAGSTGKGGAPGTGGSGTGGSAPTFTQVYTTILVTYCSGSSCHNPGSQKGVSFASQSTAYTAVKSRVTPGNGAGSSFYQTINGGSMPPGQKLSATNIALIKAWIDAGALNN